MSTSVSRCGLPKKINCWVLPGVLDVRANACRPVSALISEDLPTLERPAKAISGPVDRAAPPTRRARPRTSIVRRTSVERLRSPQRKNPVSASLGSLDPAQSTCHWNQNRGVPFLHRPGLSAIPISAGGGYGRLVEHSALRCGESDPRRRPVLFAVAL